MNQVNFKPLQFLVFIMATTCVMEQGKAKFCSNSVISSLVQLIPCRPSLSPFRPIPPSFLCCNAIKTLGQPCLCALLDGPPVSGVDYNLAMLLPQKCSADFDPCTFFLPLNILWSFVDLGLLKNFALFVGFFWCRLLKAGKWWGVEKMMNKTGYGVGNYVIAKINACFDFGMRIILVF